jgi:Zn-dependent peptidase ImmA (M78 family)/transcriptional regulator with XRE-family HTH domain
MEHAIEAAVKPAVLKWARESSGSSVEQAAKRARVPASAFAQWETAESSLRLGQLRALADYFKRPLAALLLSQPPPEPALPTDFRKLPGRSRHLERRTRLAIRRAMRLQELAHDLMQALKHDAAPLIGRAHRSDDPEAVADRERQRLDIPIDAQLGWKNSWQALRTWRAAVEGRNVLVLQLPMPVEDVRGFSLSDVAPVAIVASSSDAVQARIFTLFHEYAHLLLREPGICVPEPAPGARGPLAVVEQWCNRFAGALLVPGPTLASILETSSPIRSERDLMAAVEEGARRFRVSRLVVLRRLLDARLASKPHYQKVAAELTRKPKMRKGGGGGADPARKCLSENGRVFTSLVLEARSQGLINYADVSDYLGLRLKYLKKVETQVLMAA